MPPLHPDLYEPDLVHMDARARQAVQDADPEAIYALATPVHPGISVARLLSADYCEQLIEELDHQVAGLRDQGRAAEPPNSMHKYGIRLSDIGMDPVLDWLVRELLSPLGAYLFPDVAGRGLVNQHSFIADYGETGDRDLALHVDQSDVTFDLCLGQGFTGGDLIFEGRRCFAHLDVEAALHEEFEFAHEPGLAVIHAGKNRHYARPVTDGRRVQLVLWGRASEEPEVPDYSACAPWCGAR